MKNNEAGVTLVELLVAIALAGIVSTVIYTAYQVQMKVYQDEDDVVQMQQNIRSALAFLQSETRMAGYNPNKKPVTRVAVQTLLQVLPWHLAFIPPP